MNLKTQIIACSITTLIGLLCYYFMTGWETHVVEDYSTARSARSYWVAEYSSTQWDPIDGSYYTDYWDEVISSVPEIVEYDGVFNGDHVKVNGWKYPPFPPVGSYDKVDLDRIKKDVSDTCMVKSSFGLKEVGSSEYLKIIGKMHQGKAIYASFHHGKLFGYKAEQ